MKIIAIVFIMLHLSLLAQNTISKKDRESPHSIKETLNLSQMPSIKNISTVSHLRHMGTAGKMSGQFMLMYAGYNYKPMAAKDIYATAIGGEFKYELAKLDGFNAAAAIYTSQDINSLTGSSYKGYQNNELSSSKGKYTNIAEAYINYQHKNFNFRAGRQVIITPLADNDPIRMIEDTYEAYIATYLYHDFTFLVGNLQKWQGYDAGLDNGFIKIGKNGVWLGGIKFSNKHLDNSIWYYNILDMTNAVYADSSYHANLNQNIFLHASVQYINESELKNSGISANVYGAMIGLISHGIDIFVAYNKAIIPKHKQSFSAFGGGSLYTSMDTMILDNIAIDRDAYAYVFSASYTFHNINFIYAQGYFLGHDNSVGVKANITEQDIRLQYQLNNKTTISTMAIFDNNLQNPNDVSTNWVRAETYISYNF